MLEPLDRLLCVLASPAESHPKCRGSSSVMIEISSNDRAFVLTGAGVSAVFRHSAVWVDFGEITASRRLLPPTPGGATQAWSGSFIP